MHVNGATIRKSQQHIPIVMLRAQVRPEGTCAKLPKRVRMCGQHKLRDAAKLRALLQNHERSKCDTESTHALLRLLVYLNLPNLPKPLAHAHQQ